MAVVRNRWYSAALSRIVEPIAIVLTRLSRTIKELGLLDTVLYAVERGLVASGLSARLIRYAFVAQPVPAGPLLPPRRGRSIDVRQIDPRDPELLKLELTPDVLDYRANMDPVCFAAYEDDDIIGCLWLCMGHYDEDEVRCRYTPLPTESTCWDFGIYVLPEKRSGFGFARLWDTANGFLRGRDITWSLSRISPFNTASMASHKRLGIVRLGGAVFFRWGGWQLLASRKAPYLHVSANPQRIPHVTLHAPTEAPKPH